MEEKDFDQWNEKKKVAHFQGRLPHFSIGQIWWAQLGQNIATEINGKGHNFLRPVIILQKVYGDACLVIPLTSQARIGDYYFNFKDSHGAKQSAVLTQVRYIDGKRLKYQRAYIREDDFDNLRNFLCTLIKK